MCFFDFIFSSLRSNLPIISTQAISIILNRLMLKIHFTPSPRVSTHRQCQDLSYLTGSTHTAKQQDEILRIDDTDVEQNTQEYSIRSLRAEDD